MTTFVLVLISLLLVAAAIGWVRERSRAGRAARAHAQEIAELRAGHAAALEEAAARVRAVLDSMVEGIVVLDTAGHVVSANRAAGRLFGFTHTVTGRALIEAVRHHEVVTLAERLAREPAVLGHDLRIEGPPPLFLQVNAVALRSPTGAFDGAVLVFHDITRVRELEGVRQEFVANVSHELRTPLSLIKGAAETLADGAKSDPTALDRLLAIIDRHADRLTLLIDDLLLLAKLDSGRVVLNLQPSPLRLAVQEVVEDLAPRAASREMTLQNTLPSGLIGQADPDRLRQVLWNLIDNGIKYGRPAGTVTISGRVLDEKRVEVCVQDDGPGIPADSRARVFERFYRVDKARSREQGGTGLGLAIVKHVVQAHGGEVRVESELGQGAAFYFTLSR
ncbi:MAG TPA: ATP-binding protein [Opitutus sp.]|nr:ATP-binding protein [Opitutus sp.]